jgi:hypothetical protein
MWDILNANNTPLVNQLGFQGFIHNTFTNDIRDGRLSHSDQALFHRNQPTFVESLADVDTPVSLFKGLPKDILVTDCDDIFAFTVHLI